MNKKGFTLVELLGVIVILGIIITIVATNGFGAFDNAKTKINEENLNTIKEAANLLMTEVKNCDESIDSILIENFVGSGKNCNDLKAKASTKDENDECLIITLKYLLENDYVSGSGIESISKEYPDFYVNACINNDKVDTEVIPGEKSDGTTTTTTTTTTVTTIAENNACKDITYGKNTLAYAIICNAKSVTNEQKNSGYAEYRETPLTKPAEEISGENESTLSITQDDYGISYYYRGNVKNNYINFAGMCWRIVRVQGDGTTKLILEDKNTTCDSLTFTGNWRIGAGNYGYDDKSGVLYTLYKKNYLNPETDNSNSMMKSFYEFQTINLKNDFGNLQFGNWCLGDTAYTRTRPLSDFTYSLFLEDTMDKYCCGNIFYYDAYIRLTGYNKDGYNPTLKCNGTKLYEFTSMGNKKSVPLMYVGAITADEMVYAGGKYLSSNQNYYLINEEYKKGSDGVIEGSAFSSLTPGAFGDMDDIFILDNDGSLFREHVFVYNLFRPAVSLVNGITVTSGDGTQTNPYIVQ